MALSIPHSPIDGATGAGLLERSWGVLGTIGSYGLIAWVSGPLLRACAAALVLSERRTRAAEAVDNRLIAALERVAAALEQPASAGRVAAAPAATDPHAEVRKAIRESDWNRAEELIRALLEQRPDDPSALQLVREREEALAGSVKALLAKVDAAREVNDPDRALELRDALVPLLEAEARQSLDRDLVRWLMGLIQKRLRSGTVRPDVAELAARVAERFDHTVEGASLRASLPTLRRSAGLCARCGQPYQGIADACPACLSTASFPAFDAGPDPHPDEIVDDD